jgi:hypothetical protein
VVTNRPGQCIYGKRVVDTFLQWIGWDGEWQLWHFSGGLHIPIKHRFRYYAGLERDEPHLHLKVRIWKMTLFVLAATDSKVMQSGYSRFRGAPGVGSYKNNECLHIEMSRGILYACSVKSETITFDKRVDLRCTWISWLSKEILGWIFRKSVEYPFRVLGYNTLTRYRLDSLSIPGWLEIYCDGSVSGESKCWYRFSCAIDSKLFSIIDLVDIPNSFAILVSGACAINTIQIIWITHGSSGAPDN